MTEPRSIFLVLALTALLPLAGCGGGSSPVSFANCGNGVLDPGEQCDDGNTLDDDNCLSTCVLASCNDPFGDCNGSNLNGKTCASFMLAQGSGLACQPNCRYDTSGCGPPFTPTPANTPTPTPGLCGNGVIDPGESCSASDRCTTGVTCIVCPQDCAVAACTPGPPTETFAVQFVPGNQGATGVSVRVGYRSSVASIPGMGADASVGARVRNRPANSIVAVNDLDYALRVVLSRSTAFTGSLFTVEFDSCAGAAAPMLTDLTCTVEQCSSANGAVSGCSCTVSGPLTPTPTRAATSTPTSTPTPTPQ